MDCPICLESISNIHALMCGHSFCGPPKPCLNFLKHDNGMSTKCAVCNTVLPFKVSDLKPLYGIQEILNDIRDNSKNKETPLLDEIDSFLSYFDCEVELLTDKKLQLEQLKKHKASIAQFADGKNALTKDLKELLESDWIQYFDPELKILLNSFNFRVTITRVETEKTLFADSHHLGGFLFTPILKPIGCINSVGLREEWFHADLLINSVLPSEHELETEMKFQLTLISSDPDKNLKLQSNLKKVSNTSESPLKFVLVKYVLDTTNGFVSNDRSITLEVYVEAFRVLNKIENH